MCTCWAKSAPTASTSTTTTWCRSTRRRPSATRSSRDFKQALQDTGLVVPMATTNLFSDPVFKDGAFTSQRSAGARLRHAEDHAGDGPGRRAGRRGSTSSGAAAKASRPTPPRTRSTPSSASARRINFLCEYVLDQGYDLKFALEAKPNEPRGDIYFATTGAHAGVHPHPRSPRDGRRQPRGGPRAHGRAELHATAWPRRWTPASCSTST